MKRDTTLKPWPPDLPTTAKAEAFRQHIIDHLAWIAENRSDNQHYVKIAALYRRQLVSTSALIARLQAQANDYRKLHKSTVKAA